MSGRARKVRYSVAMSLDGFIAGPSDEFDWIAIDPEIDFTEMISRFDTLLMGRRTYEVTQAHGEGGSPAAMPGMRIYVASRTLRPEDHPDVTIVGDDLIEVVRRLRDDPGSDKEIWLFGGGELFASLLGAGLVDAIEVAVIPILLGGGKPFLPAPADRAGLRLTSSRVYEATGTVLLEYDATRGPGRVSS